MTKSKNKDGGEGKTPRTLVSAEESKPVSAKVSVGQVKKPKKVRTMRTVEAKPDDPIYRTGYVIGSTRLTGGDDSGVPDEVGLRRVTKELGIQALAEFLKQAQALFDVEEEEGG